MISEEMADLAEQVARATARPAEGIACVVILADVNTKEIVTGASVPSRAEYAAILSGANQPSMSIKIIDLRGPAS